jgi:hypothetical protein
MISAAGGFAGNDIRTVTLGPRTVHFRPLMGVSTCGRHYTFTLGARVDADHAQNESIAHAHTQSERAPARLHPTVTGPPHTTGIEKTTDPHIGMQRPKL